MSNYTSTILEETPLWGQRWEEPDRTPEKGKCRLIKSKTVMVEGDKVLAIHMNTLVQGMSKNGVPWSKWRNDRSWFYSMKSGKFRAYKKEGKHFRDSTKEGNFQWLGNPLVQEAYNRLLTKNGLEPVQEFGYKTIFHTAYPMFTHWKEAHRAYGVPYMSSSSMQEFAVNLFGKTRYRKDLVRALATAKSGTIVKNAHAARGLVPIDWIVNYLKADRPVDFVLPRLREALKKMTPQQRKVILTVMTKPTNSDAFYVMDDLLDFAAQLPEDVVQSVKMKPSNQHEVHMILSVEATKMRTQCRDIPETATAKKITKTDWSGTTFTVMPAKTTHEVIGWGSEMQHCIGGYANQAVNGDVTLTGIYQNDKLIGNAMFKDKQAVQIFGRFNKQLPDDILKRIIERMDGYSFKNTWGVPDYLRTHADPGKWRGEIEAPHLGELVAVPF